MKIDHTYLRAPKGSLVFVRRKQGEHINLYDYELRYEQGDERIQKKRIISAAEYQEMLALQQDYFTNILKIYRTSFMYEKHYFQLETFTNIIGSPSFLLVETEEFDDQSPFGVKVPPYLKIRKDVTSDKFYSSNNMAKKNF